LPDEAYLPLLKEAHLERLDQDFMELFGLLKVRAPDHKVEELCWKILRDAESEWLSNEIIKNEKGEIIKNEKGEPTRRWEVDWQSQEHVSWVRIGDIRHNPVCRFILQAFIEVIRLVKWTGGSYGKQKQRNVLREAVCDCLESRGKEIRENSDEDGPYRPNGLRYKGNEAEEMENIPWRLLSALWGKERAPIGEIASQVWGHDESEDAIKSALQKVNRALEEVNVPWNYGRKAGQFVKI